MERPTESMVRELAYARDLANEFISKQIRDGIANMTAGKFLIFVNRSPAPYRRNSYTLECALAAARKERVTEIDAFLLKLQSIRSARRNDIGSLVQIKTPRHDGELMETYLGRLQGAIDAAIRVAEWK